MTKVFVLILVIASAFASEPEKVEFEEFESWKELLARLIMVKNEYSVFWNDFKTNSTTLEADAMPELRLWLIFHPKIDEVIHKVPRRCRALFDDRLSEVAREIFELKKGTEYFTGEARKLIISVNLHIQRYEDRVNKVINDCREKPVPQCNALELRNKVEDTIAIYQEQLEDLRQRCDKSYKSFFDVNESQAEKFKESIQNNIVSPVIACASS